MMECLGIYIFIFFSKQKFWPFIFVSQYLVSETEKTAQRLEATSEYISSDEATRNLLPA